MEVLVALVTVSVLFFILWLELRLVVWAIGVVVSSCR